LIVKKDDEEQKATQTEQSDPKPKQKLDSIPLPKISNRYVLTMHILQLLSTIFVPISIFEFNEGRLNKEFQYWGQIPW